MSEYNLKQPKKLSFNLVRHVPSSYHGFANVHLNTVYILASYSIAILVTYGENCDLNFLNFE